MAESAHQKNKEAVKIMTTFSRVIAVAIFVSSFLACATPGTVTKDVSDFDGAVSYTSLPGSVYQNESRVADFSIGAHWNDKFPDKIVLDVAIFYKFIPIQKESGLQFMIDGELVKLDSPDVLTDLKSEQAGNIVIRSSERSFVAPFSIVDKINNAKVVKVKLLLDKAYMEGDLKVRGDALKAINNVAEKARAHAK